MSKKPKLKKDGTLDRRAFNKGTEGNAGGASHSIKEQIWHKTKWETDQTVAELEKKIKSGVYAVRDVYILHALKGDKVILKNLADKVLATLHDITSDGKPLPQPILGIGTFDQNDDNKA